MNIFRQLTVRIGADISGLATGMGAAVSVIQSGTRRISASMEQVGQAMERTGQTLTTRLTLPLLAVGVAAAKMAGDFEASMLRLQAISGASAAELEQLRQKAMAMGATTKFSASDAAEALNFMAMAGMNASNSLKSLPYVLQLAAAAGLDMARSAEIVTNIMAGYRLRVEELAHVNDVLVFTMNATNTGLSDLAEALKYAGPIASAAGVKFEEAAAILGLMGNAGIQASMAGTSLRAALSRLLTPTDQITAAMKAAGIELHRTSEGGVDLLDLVRQLEPRVNDAGLMMTLFGQRAGPAFAAVVSQGADALERLTIQAELSAGSAERVADAYNQGLNGALSSLQSSLESVALAIGRAGLTEGLTKMANGLADMFRSLSQVNPQLLMAATYFAGIVAAAGPIIVVLGTIVRSFGAMLGVLAGPVGVVAMIAAVLGGMVLWAQLKAQIQGVESAMRDAAGPIQRIAELNQQLADATGDAASALRDLRQEQTRMLASQTGQAQAELQGARRDFVQANQGPLGFMVDTPWSRETLRVQQAEARFNTLNAQLQAAIAQNADTDSLPERQRIYREAFEAFRRARRTEGFDREAWLRANPQYAASLRAGDPGGTMSTRTGATGGDLDLLDLGGLNASGQVAPSVRRRQEIESLREQASATGMTADEIERLAKVREVLAEAQNAGEPITRAEAEAFVDEVSALENTIASQRQLAEERDAAISQQVHFREELALEEQQRRELTEAALQGAEAYQRLLVVQDLMRRNTALSREEAEAMADSIIRSNRTLERAQNQMQRMADMARGIGDAFASAFERAIFQGEKLSDVLKSLARDILQLVLRATVVQPLANGITNLINGVIGGVTGGGGGGKSGGSSVWSAIMSSFAGGFAEGGFIPPGKWGVTGERGPEPIFGGRSGVSVHPNQGAGAQILYAPTYTFTGGTKEELQEVRAMIANDREQFTRKVAGVVGNLNQRGRGWAG